MQPNGEVALVIVIRIVVLALALLLFCTWFILFLAHVTSISWIWLPHLQSAASVLFWGMHDGLGYLWWVR